MVRLLVKAGADLETPYSVDTENDQRTPIEALLLSKDGFSGRRDTTAEIQAYILEALRVLLENGSEIPHRSGPMIYDILLHGMINPPLYRTVEIIKLLVTHGLDLEAVQNLHLRFVDMALNTGFNAVVADWVWLLEHGLKIHGSTVSSLYSADYQDHALRTHRCRNPAFYTPRARIKAAKFNPDWTFSEKYLNVASRLN